ncbi:hypothetical protein BLS_007169 [Venturia inaequalis]|uniref:Guanine nucleotide-binding protein alpha-2 subunit n=1 Tax=Venturia inaequalis TaxID=5025 RepID=A0A8H3YK85_VENIN|nr:hypothetical protein EG328_011333 [Venturia inaequalis]KAE9972330.1 hypothetical protein EG327_009516 [Venturia inaequalis]KAE9981619.1 hypothetical protein BLS_007169 [Venturia inaequalis]RDI83569.1 hypothetical protein Vi05172_g6748 [Venturia inaequalis]
MAPVLMCFGRKSQDPEKLKNEEIERGLRADKKRQEREVKLLLLGAGESGKSTVLKQMRIINTEGFNKQERKAWRVTIFDNLVNSFQCILGEMEHLDVTFEDENNEEHGEWLNSDPSIEPEQRFPPHSLDVFQSLWDDKGVQLAMLKGHEYALHDNLRYYMEDSGGLDRLYVNGYLPTDQDILRARLRTTGISETLFNINQYTYRMFDVGGQRSERKKWIHVFDNVQVVLFLVAISGYDHALVEDRNGNQMHEALMLFESIANSKYFERSALILFLNKIDLFTEKVRSNISPIDKWFPDYRGPQKGQDPVDAAKTFFAEKFKCLVRTPNKQVYVHYTNATDTNLLAKTMSSVQDMIVQRNLQNLIL